jgi:hypothetical protein
MKIKEIDKIMRYKTGITVIPIHEGGRTDRKME